MIIVADTLESLSDEWGCREVRDDLERAANSSGFWVKEAFPATGTTAEASDHRLKTGDDETSPAADDMNLMEHLVGVYLESLEDGLRSSVGLVWMIY